MSIQLCEAKHLKEFKLFTCPRLLLIAALLIRNQIRTNIKTRDKVEVLPLRQSVMQMSINPLRVQDDLKIEDTQAI